MTGIHDKTIAEGIKITAEKLKGQLEMPQWVKFVKTGAAKQRKPVQYDWWYLRAASILRHVYKNGPIGTSKLRAKYGSRKNRGHKPQKFFKGGGKIIRNILQQLEKTGYINYKKEGVHKGRIITPKGQSLLGKK